MEEDDGLDRGCEEKAEEISLKTVLGGINSHYFFDALHVIKGYIAVDEKKAMDTINLLARTVRKGVRLLKEGKACIKISEELEYVRLYLELAQMHYGQVEYTILNHSEDFFVPIFTVRHLVEDAFTRCITAEPEFRNLRVYTFSDNTHDYIEIKDSGSLLSKEEIEQLMTLDSKAKGNAYLLYESCGWRVELKSLPDEGNRVFLSHPRKD